LNTLQKRDSLSAIDESVVVRQRNVHHLSGYHGTIDDGGSQLGGMHAQDGALGRVDDGGAEQRAKHTAVRDSKGSSSHVFNLNLSGLSLLSVMADSLFDILQNTQK
jgi:hypothetical protein